MTKLSAAAHAVELADEAAYLEAVAQVRKAADAYYGSGESGLDDETYDRLLRGVTAWAHAHPGQIAADSPSQQVAAGVTAPRSAGAASGDAPAAGQKPSGTPSPAMGWTSTAWARRSSCNSSTRD
jgi:hypothetical protein